MRSWDQTSGHLTPKAHALSYEVKLPTIHRPSIYLSICPLIFAFMVMWDE